MKKAAMIGAVVAVVMAATAQGQSSTDPGTAVATSFKSLDANRDGRISQTEAAMQSELSSAFTTADTNSNGSLSESEFQKWHKQQATGSSKPSGSEMSPSSSSTPNPDSSRPGAMKDSPDTESKR